MIELAHLHDTAIYQKGPENWVCRIMDAIDENMRQVAIAADAKEAAYIS